MRDVVGFGAVGLRAARAGAAQHRADVVRGTAHRGAVGFGGGGFEATLEEAPRDAFGVEQVADVLVGGAELHLVAIGAVVAVGLRIVDQGALTVAGVVDDVVVGETAAGVNFLTTPWVWLETRLIAPSADGPNVVL
jgi:hypothetical protein